MLQARRDTLQGDGLVMPPVFMENLLSPLKCRSCILRMIFRIDKMPFERTEDVSDNVRVSTEGDIVRRREEGVRKASSSVE
jgi:hypothetical protein